MTQDINANPRPLPQDFITGDDRDDEYCFNAYLAAVASWESQMKPNDDKRLS